MTDSAKEQLNYLVKRFGAIEEGDPETYDKIKKIVFAKSIEWEKNNDADADTFLFKAVIDKHIWKLRINNFPDEPMYTLFIDDKAIITFDDRPKTWVIKNVD